MSIDVENFKRLFDMAVNDDSNIDEDGQLDWNFVDVDLWKAVKPTDEDRGQYWDLFDSMAEELEQREAEILTGGRQNVFN